MNFLSLCYCLDSGQPFRLASGSAKSTQRALYHFQRFATTEGIKPDNEALSKYLHVLIKTDVPNRFDTTRKMQHRKDKAELRSTYEALAEQLPSPMPFTLEQFTETNMPYRSDFIYVSPEQFLELTEEPGIDDLRLALSNLLMVPPTAEGISKHRRKELRRAADKHNVVARVGGLIFTFVKIAYVVLGGPDWPELDVDGPCYALNRKVALRSAWLLTLREFSEKICKIQNDAPPVNSDDGEGLRSAGEAT